MTRMHAPDSITSATLLLTAALLLVLPAAANSAELRLSSQAHSVASSSQARRSVASQLPSATNPIVGYCDADFPYSEAAVRSTETAIGNLVTDAIKWYVSSYLKPYYGASFSAAIFTSGCIRGGFSAGFIYKNQVNKTLPCNYNLVILSLMGVQIIQALEHSVSGPWGNNSAYDGRFLQVSGLNFTFDPSKPVGKRVLSALIKKPPGNWVEIKKCAPYKLATSDYLAGGGDGFTMLTGGIYTFNTKFTEILEIYLSNAKFPKPLAPHIEGRIIRCPGPATCPATRTVVDTVKRC